MKIKTLVLFAVSCICFFNESVAQTKTSQVIQLNEGSGSFLIAGGVNHENDSIKIYYHKPKDMTSKSKILLVIPGSGRNGDNYRDSWIEASEKYNVLIISPSYPEENYPYGDYHLGGAVKNLNLIKGISIIKNTNQMHMDEDVVKFNINPNQDEWIFNDFDRIFELVKKATNSKQKRYDMFGHSAGGQILHRFALMQPKSKADRILASNSGTYTLPDNSIKFPFGMDLLNQKNLKHAFKKNLVLFLGELDNEHETGGIMLRSKTADIQGTNRLARGNYFYDMSVETAKKSHLKLNWKLEIIPNIGHNKNEMAKAAANYLYMN